MPARLIREAEAEVVDRGGGVRSIPLMNGANGAIAVTTGMTIVDAGAGLPLHFHDTEECITCVEGEAHSVVDGEEFVLRPYDHIWIPEGAHHRFWNEGQTRMRILWTYGKPEVMRTFVQTGETVRHMSSEDRAILP